MSRIGKLPIPLHGAKVTLSGNTVTAVGARGEDTFVLPDGITIEVTGEMVNINRRDDSPDQRRLHGVTRAQLNNRILGVTRGHTLELVVQGKGYQAELVGKSVEMQIGFSHKVVATIPEGLKVELKLGQNTFGLVISGNDKQLVGNFASTLYKIRPVEPYNLIGFRYSDQQIKRKAAKSATS
ncbi:MAG: 50S ribosomal protein L6 [Candidatus Fermentibacteraceae bacterium]